MKNKKDIFKTLILLLTFKFETYLLSTLKLLLHAFKNCHSYNYYMIIMTITHLGISSNCAITSGVVGCLVLRDTNLEKRSISYFSNPNNLYLSSYIDSNSCPQLLSQILSCSSLIVRATFSPQAPAQSLKCNIFSFCLFGDCFFLFPH